MIDRERDTITVRRAMDALRSADESSVPSFDVVRSRARRPGEPMRWSGVRIMTIAAVAAVAVISVVGTNRLQSRARPQLAVPADVRELSNWRPATDVLLDTPGRALLRISPQLGASLITLPVIGASS